MLPRPRRLRPRRLAGACALAGTVGILFSAGAAYAQVQVTVAPTVTVNGGLYNYSYTVTNFTATELALVNLNNLPLVPGALFDFSAPAGFQFGSIPYDSTVGIETFLPDSSANPGMFASGSTISGFSFSSAFGPGAVSFDTQDINGANPVNGMTIGPNAAVPEASTLVSLGAGLALLTFVAVRRRRSIASVARS